MNLNNQWPITTVCKTGSLILLAQFCTFLSSAASIAAKPKYAAWTTSRLVGSPDPPLPYILERANGLEFTGPISLNRIPGSTRMLVLEQKGAIYWFDAAGVSPVKKLLVDLNSEIPPKSGVKSGGGRRVELFSLAFHPAFAENSWVFLCYITTGGQEPTETHIAHLQLNHEHDPKLLVESELDILTCEGGGHNGCTVLFGKDGYLYFSLGDLASPNPPDPRDTGQDISDLYSSILRIDVDQRANGNNYAIPADNPFVNLPEARAEVYSYGFRNPFRMSFDPLTGDLWVGDVGWEAWEMVYRVRSGGNYGWAIKEGPGEVKQQTPGPTPILPADIALGHAEAASVTGGLVYRGEKYPELKSTYIFGDWITRKFWAANFDASQVTSYREIAVGSVKPICFEYDLDGELLILDYSEANQPAGIYRLEPNPALKQQLPNFPRRLSESGLFADTPTQTPAPGVAPYAINSPMWKDGAKATFWLAVPGEKQPVFFQEPQKTFDWFETKVKIPDGSVLVKTYSLPSDSERQTRPIETQISLKDEQGEWQYYTYRWNEESTDAFLVDASGSAVEVDWTSAAGESKKLVWQFGSRTSCRICHTPWRGEALAFDEAQLRRPWKQEDSWRQLLTAGYVTNHENSSPLPDSDFGGLVDPHDASHPLDQHTASYLHSNCAHCHLFGGNASTAFDISFQKPLMQSEAVNKPPMRGELGLTGAQIIRPGKPLDSILFYRVAKGGSGRMPHIGSDEPDPLATQLLKQWIAQLPSDEDLLGWVDTLCAPVGSVADDDRRIRAAKQLLNSTGGAMELAAAFAEGRVPERLAREIIDEALKHPPAIADLLEAYGAPDQRRAKLGTNFAQASILQLDGDAEQGKQLFEAGVGTCSSCHRIGSIGKQIGPDLSKSLTRLKTKEAVLQSIVQPSAEIAKEFESVNVLTSSDQILIGNLLSEDEEGITLRDANGKTIAIPASDIEAIKTSVKSLMPDGLLAPLTAQQAADLLEFLFEML